MFDVICLKMPRCPFHRSSAVAIVVKARAGAAVAPAQTIRHLAAEGDNPALAVSHSVTGGTPPDQATS